MASLFGIQQPARDTSLELAQRKQNEDLRKREGEQKRELGARRRLLEARRSGRTSLFAQTGAAGVRSETLGG